MKLIILSSQSTKVIEEEAEKYNIAQIGSLSVANGQYFLTALGELKVPEEVSPVSKSTTKRVAAQKKVT